MRKLNVAVGHQLGLLGLVVSQMPWCYGALGWWPHDRFARILSEPVAVIASAALIGAAASRGPKWWLIALIAPVAAIMLLLTAGV